MDKVVLIAVASLALAGCQSIQYAHDQGGGCYAGTIVGATAGGVAGSAIGAGSGQLAAIAGGIALGGAVGYAVTPGCHSKVEAYAPVATPVYK